AEIEYALDVLKTDGGGLMTSVSQQWFGNRAFAPVMDEAPQSSGLCASALLPQPEAGGPRSFDRVRHRHEADDRKLMLTGTSHRYSDIRFIFAHAGITMPFITEQMTWWFDVKKDLVGQMPSARSTSSNGPTTIPASPPTPMPCRPCCNSYRCPRSC